VQASAIVDGLDEGADLATGVVDGGVGFAVDLLGFQRLHEALGFGVVVRIAGPAHAGGDFVRLQPLEIV
jgi:hypothetical protein